MAIKRKIAGSRKQYSLFYLSFALNTLIYLLLAFLERYTWKPGVVVSLRPSFFECIQLVTKLGAGMLGHACKSVLYILLPQVPVKRKRLHAKRKETRQDKQIIIRHTISCYSEGSVSFLFACNLFLFYQLLHIRDMSCTPFVPLNLSWATIPCCAVCF